MKFFLLVGLAGSWVISGWWSPVFAEIVPDATLPRPSRVTPARGRTAITAGTQRGRNLFHSFQEFSVDPGEVASFQGIDSSIASIFARVTGRNISRIDGVIEVLQQNDRISSANLFLLNPNGIIFGRNASLRIGGSFIASTADSINFSDGTQFSAVALQTSPLLTVSAPIGLQFGSNPGQIINRAKAPWLDEAGEPVNDALGSQIFGLVGGTNQTFALVGSDITFAGGRVLVDGGRIEIGSVAGNSQVTLTPVTQGWDLSYEGVRDFSDVQVLNGILDGTGSVGSTIQIQGKRVLLQDVSLVFTASASSNQLSGAIEVAATDSIVVAQQSFLSTETYSSGQAGNIILSTQRLNVRTGGQVGSRTFAEGRGGNVQINASESVTVADVAPFLSSNPDELLSLLYAQSESGGPAGDLRIETDRLQVRSGGQIGTTTFDTGNAGNLTIQANTIELTGIALDVSGQPLFDSNEIPIPGGLFVGTSPDSAGNGGELRIVTQRLSVRDGAILQATTYGSGDAGDVRIRATESIEVNGISEQGGSQARITATSGGLPTFNPRLARAATGRGGTLNLDTDRLTVQNGGVIAVNSRNRTAAGAGNINIRANQIVLDNQAQLNAQTESGDEAGIQLTGVDLLTLRRNSNISTSAGLRSGGGDGGDIRIVDAGLILNAPGENSDINANAGDGNGGSIAIGAQGILGITERAQPTFQSDITATSESGVDGEISISNPTLDPTQGIVELPSTVVDASQLIAQGCRAGNRAIADQLGEFVITGRGGLPPNPTDLRGSSAVITNLATLPPSSSSAVSLEPSAIPTDFSARNNRPVIEAQGWVIDQDGKVALVANAPAVTPYSPNWTVPHCISQAVPDKS